MEHRQTEIAEDKVYLLLSILNVEIPLYYSKEAVNAFESVREVVDKHENCLRDLRLFLILAMTRSELRTLRVGY